jgi:hypothetical protein
MQPGYKTIETVHFVVKYSTAAKEKAQTVADEAEKIYEPVTHVFQLQAPRKTMIVLEEYEQKKLAVGQFMPGYTDKGIIHIYNDPYDRVPVNITLPHEFSHVMIRHKYDGAYMIPAWLDEGIAVNIETSITGNKRKTDDDWNEEKSYSIETLEKVRTFAELDRNPDTIYHQCSGMVGYIVEIHGEKALFQILEKITHDRKPFAEVVQSILHIDVLTLSHNGQRYFRDNYYIRGVFNPTAAPY